MFRRSGVTPLRERVLILTAVLAPIGFAFLGSPWSTIGGAAISILLLATILRGRALHLHGAEHRAIAAVEERRLVTTWAGNAKPTRFSPRCGTNFAALVLPVTFLADKALPVAPAFWTPLVVLVLSLALTMEIWRVVQGSSQRRLAGVSPPGARPPASHDP